jgi:enoyl-CoA hydratase/carnithine racemase
MDDDLLLVEQPAAGVRLLRLHRPRALNALNLALRRRLAQAFIEADADATVRVVVMAGSSRAFCAGADLHEYVDAGPLEIVARDMGRLWDAIAACRKPVIAAVRGHALGGGCELAMHADLIVAGRGASFGQPEVKIGLMPGGGATQRLVRAVGKYNAMRVLLAGDAVGAEDARTMGLVSDLVDDEQVEPHALALAQRLAALPAMALASVKACVLEAMDVPLAAGLAAERRAFQLLFATADKAEGIRARLEKREPRFPGR